ncbi:MAG: hypothetical protein WBI07_04850 [Mobilitalea sp.]
METGNSVLEWLMSGDPSIKYQTMRDLLEYQENDCIEQQRKIAEEGWGKQLLDLRDNDNKTWGNGIYSPKWISTHYTLLQLKEMGISPDNPAYIESSEFLLNRLWNKDAWNGRYCDLCVVGMILSICTYCNLKSEKINEMIDYILEKQFIDGGWNCDWYSGAVKSSLHTTISILEAFRDYENSGYTYRLEEIKRAIPKGQDFILRKRLFRSERTGEIIHKTMTMLSYPCRWKYDILRAMDYFQSVHRRYDPRMEEAMGIILGKRRKDDRWPMQQKYSGLVHFDMEKAGQASRWNTLRVLRILKFYKK